MSFWGKVNMRRTCSRVISVVGSSYWKIGMSRRTAFASRKRIGVVYRACLKDTGLLSREARDLGSAAGAAGHEKAEPSLLRF